MDKIVEKNLLYDFYGELLTGHQRRIYEDAVFNDLSLSELSEDYGITRQGIHDLLRRCDKLLMGYEDKLKMVEKSEAIKKIAEQIIESLKESNAADTDKISTLAQQIIDIL